MPFTPCILAENLTNSPLFADYSTENIETYLPNGIHYLQQINCFSGANNAGKSRLLRHLFQSVGEDSLLSRFKDTSIPTSADVQEIFNSLSEDEENINCNEFYNHLKNVLTPENYINTNTKKIYGSYKYLHSLNMNEEKISNLHPILGSKLVVVQNIINDTRRENDNLNIKISNHNKFKTLFDNIEAAALNYKNNTNNHSITYASYKNMIDTIASEIKKIQFNDSFYIYKKDIDYLLSLFETVYSYRHYNSTIDVKLFFSDIDRVIKTCTQKNVEISVNINNINKEINTNTIEKNINNYLKQKLSVFKDSFLKMFKSSNPKLNKLYIPILRGTRPFDKNMTDFYAERTKLDYNIDEKHIFTGLSFYTELRAHLLGTHTKRKLIRDFEVFLSESFFNGQEITLVPNIEADVVYIKIGDQNDIPIYNLGDGIQALIILTFPLFLRKDKPYMIFIEEPEAHLHPAWQRFFLATIKQYFHKHQFFFTTHSSIFLSEPTASLYAINRPSVGYKTIISYVDGSMQDLLDELGYKASDLLQANYIIWVEGISDTTYIKNFIKAYDSTLIYGVDYVIMWYGGQQLDKIVAEKFNTLNQLNPKFGIVLDSDFNKEPKSCSLAQHKKDTQEQCSKMNKFCWVTQVREIENLIPEDIWYKACIVYANKVKRMSLSLNDESIIQNRFENADYDDRFGVTVQYGENKNDIVKCVTKVTMAESVATIFPKTKADLERVSELFENIENLVAAIKSSTKSALQEK
jgi:AAA15 family ATPase/GTPase